MAYRCEKINKEVSQENIKSLYRSPQSHGRAMLSPAQLHMNKGQVPGSSALWFSRGALHVYFARLWVVEQGWKIAGKKRIYGDEEPDVVRQMLTSFLMGRQLFKEMGTGHEHLRKQGTGI